MNLSEVIFGSVISLILTAMRIYKINRLPNVQKSSKLSQNHFSERLLDKFRYYL